MDVKRVDELASKIIGEINDDGSDVDIAGAALAVVIINILWHIDRSEETMVEGAEALFRDIMAGIARATSTGTIQ